MLDALMANDSSFVAHHRPQPQATSPTKCASEASAKGPKKAGRPPRGQPAPTLSI
ncbi:hypothetical protein GCWU000325_01542 [Alloprevotella tannerae ATCC 51259]|uniref:Uncharacterized protein n=1 Tax=Alloprevotella tannerae ATCC 51259 TaxID=626522 RepID=C9LH41_9BACT|nr:hypothetical protein GCWU000325_01542 [Alloprevotella tannerae ATCC 51259]